MLVNFASGVHPFPPPWRNLDLNDHPGVDERVDLTHSVGTAADVGVAYVGHFLEHLLYSECLAFLTRVRAVMRPGGVIVVVCPDAAKAAAMARDGRITPDLLAQIRPHGFRTDNDVSHIHAWEPTPAKVRWLLEHTGFADPADSDFESVVPLGVPLISDAEWQLVVTAKASR